MDIATILGVFSGIALMLISIKMNSGLDLFISYPSLMIVMGGTVAATLIAYPLKEFLSVWGLFVRVFRFKSADPAKFVEQLVDISKQARKGGLLSIEDKLADIKDRFLVKALQMTADGVATADIVGILRKEITIQQKKHKVGWEIFSAMGKYSPAFGMVGTLIGLIQMLVCLDNPETIGPKMGVALITTFYGVIFANLIFVPMSVKLQRRSEEETLTMNLLLEGVLSIREGENPRLMEDRLMVYIQSMKKETKNKNKKN
ncbi:MAG: MotA/TolQ/ExbB proton channel family protein [Thermodesulfobacteriota bacterium]|nr:MotA/TolQ/ExbB proton channel family protein [Thermodesulfobacteriota bacterium]